MNAAAAAESSSPNPRKRSANSARCRAFLEREFAVLHREVAQHVVHRRVKMLGGGVNRGEPPGAADAEEQGEQHAARLEDLPLAAFAARACIPRRCDLRSRSRSGLHVFEILGEFGDAPVDEQAVPRDPRVAFVTILAVHDQRKRASSLCSNRPVRVRPEVPADGFESLGSVLADWISGSKTGPPTAGSGEVPDSPGTYT